MSALETTPHYRQREGLIGAAITDVLLRARAAYDRAAALNSCHRQRDKPGRADRFDETVEAVEALGRVMARLRLMIESEPERSETSAEMPRVLRRPAGSGGGAQ